MKSIFPYIIIALALSLGLMEINGRAAKQHGYSSTDIAALGDMMDGDHTVQWLFEDDGVQDKPFIAPAAN